MNMQDVVLNGLLYNREYITKVLSFIDVAYFEYEANKIIFNVIKDYFNKYENLIPLDALLLTITEKPGILQNQIDAIIEKCKQGELSKDNEHDVNWLIDETENWCKQRAIYNALTKCISIWKGDLSTKNIEPITAIPDILQEALSVSFDTAIGLDYGDNEELFQRYNNTSKKFPFDIELFNTTTNGGVEPKTLNIVQASSGVGKSAFLCHYAASQIQARRNVLYITLEMAEEKVAQRIDANLMQIPFKELNHIQKTKDLYIKRREKLFKTGIGKLIIKEYPPASVGSKEFQRLLNEIYNKKGIKFDIVIVDYLGIVKSDRISLSSGTYSYMKAISEELRALAVKNELAIFSAVQTNRDGVDSSSLSLKNISDSLGIVMTADYIFGLISLEEHAAQDKALIIQLKNRYSSIYSDRKFYVGYDRSMQRFFDSSDQPDDISVGASSDIPIFDKTNIGERITEESSFSQIKW